MTYETLTVPPKRAGWAIPTGLIVLSAIPVLAAGIRFVDLTGGGTITADNARFHASPVPIYLHIVSVTVFSVLGAFQFAPRFRRRRIGWHRAAGRLLVPSGIIAALSGLWMTFFYPRPVGDGDLLVAFRLVFGTAMLASLVLGYLAIRRRQVARHRAWMMRGYAIGVGAGTQALISIPWSVIAGAPEGLTRTLLLGAGWAINLALAEWLIRRRRLRS